MTVKVTVKIQWQPVSALCYSHHLAECVDIKIYRNIHIWQCLL